MLESMQVTYAWNAHPPSQHYENSILPSYTTTPFHFQMCTNKTIPFTFRAHPRKTSSPFTFRAHPWKTSSKEERKQEKYLLYFWYFLSNFLYFFWRGKKTRTRATFRSPWTGHDFLSISRIFLTLARSYWVLSLWTVRISDNKLWIFSAIVFAH